MKRAGFTMIELIFVIVILGILAAVAVPKLAATRDDANVAKSATQLATLVSDLGSFYTARGGFSTVLSDMTNVPVSNNAQDLNTSGNSVTLGGADCITLISDGTAGSNGGSSAIIVKYLGTGSPTELCKSVVSVAGPMFGKAVNWTPAAVDVNITHTFGGSRVTF